MRRRLDSRLIRIVSWGRVSVPYSSLEYWWASVSLDSQCLNQAELPYFPLKKKSQGMFEIGTIPVSGDARSVRFHFSIHPFALQLPF